jgi:hypothetical protein
MATSRSRKDKTINDMARDKTQKRNHGPKVQLHSASLVPGPVLATGTPMVGARGARRIPQVEEGLGRRGRAHDGSRGRIEAGDGVFAEVHDGAIS